MYCIYRVTNKINGKTYIGQHKYVDDENPMKGYTGSGKLLKKAYEKYSIENFSIEVLYKRIQYQDTADSMEIWMIEKERNSNENGCYNICNGGRGNNGWICSEEDRIKISERTKAAMSRPEVKAKTQKGLDKCHSREIIEKARKTRKETNNKLTAEERKKKYTHKPITDEQQKKAQDALREKMNVVEKQINLEGYITARQAKKMFGPSAFRNKTVLVKKYGQMGAYKIIK